ncbi:hypothetical protein EST38_g407 [Candolleomyces aberdarensis]|uniref:Methylenetetrahydrofolate dehydrogenase n=1 Tax=Candolleomyces aberdarensis TaxID=2316362 RepID=A0A4Q2DY58_9AGAR|nr:hypothetical protein EST38_g407 [Candolleomyces aberdarensis]
MAAPAPAAAPAGKGILLKADPIAAAYRDEVKSMLAQASTKPKLVGILSTSSEPSKSYAEFTRRQCEELGVEFVLKKTGAALEAELGEGEGVEEAIIEANEDESVNGIMVYFPIFGPQQDHYLHQVVSPLKDVEGLHFKFHYNLYHNIRFLNPKSLLETVTTPSGHTTSTIDGEVPPPGMVKSIIPCTPLAIVKCLEYLGVYNRILPYGDRAYGKTITVINRSEVVGRPLAALLSNDGARVYSVDIDSIQEVLAQSDAVVSAVPNASYKVKTEWLKDGCICLNVAADKNFEKEVRDKASIYVPAVGKVTILMLLRNLLRLQQYQRIQEESK